MVLWVFSACSAIGLQVPHTDLQTLVPGQVPSTQETPQAFLAFLKEGVPALGTPQAYLAFLKEGDAEPTSTIPSILRTVAPSQAEHKLALPLTRAGLAPHFYFPDSEVVYSPSALDVDLPAYLKQAGGALGRHQEYLASSGWSSAAAIIERVAIENSINPRLLTALLEYQCGCVLSDSTTALESGYALGVQDFRRKGLYGQAWWAANQLSLGYYGWKEGWLGEISLPDGTLWQPSPDLNPGSVALQVYFARLWLAHDQSARMGAETWAVLNPHAFDGVQFQQALDPQDGFLQLYQRMFGDPDMRAQAYEPLLPPGLRQPEFILPFEPGRLWSFASGPHQAWEKESSLAALDFAPATQVSGCEPSNAWVVAVADGPVVRVGPGLVMQDLDGEEASDGKEQTGWAILYMHIADRDKAALGAHLRQGQPLGHPSCEGGPATGTHLHIARKYNGEWVAAGGALPFVLDGWIAQAGQKPYEGILVKEGMQVIAHPYGSFETQISRPKELPTPTTSADESGNGQNR